MSGRDLDFSRESPFLDETERLVQMDAPDICGEHFQPDLLYLRLVLCLIQQNLEQCPANALFSPFFAHSYAKFT